MPAVGARGVPVTTTRRARRPGHGVEPREHVGGDVERLRAGRLRDRGEQRAADARIELGVEHGAARERERAGAERALAGEQLRDGAVQLGAPRVELRGDGDGARVELRAADHAP